MKIKLMHEILWIQVQLYFYQKKIKEPVSQVLRSPYVP